MELNRDLAILSISALQKKLKHKLRICEPLTGCGIRGIRIANEVDNVREIILNDINEKAAKLVKTNIDRNNLSHYVTVENKDANTLLSLYGAPKKRFDYVDIDPFGSPIPYIDSALRATRRNGLIAITATDLAPLCGIHPKACLRKYGGKPLRTEYSHELAIRLLIGSLAKSAAKYDIGIKVLFSYSSEHYIRLYSQIDFGARKADKTIKEIGFIQHCFNCFHREVNRQIEYQKKCPKCGEKISYAGPLWTGKISDEEFIISLEKELRSKSLRMTRQIRYLLSLVKAETKAPITYYRVDRICDHYNLPNPSIESVITELKKSGIQATRTHFSTNGIKSSASAKVITQTIANLARNI
jgi:tRNA (guanine26-N2/guanine27-N2)-dimethyltransferase